MRPGARVAYATVIPVSHRLLVQFVSLEGQGEEFQLT